VRISSNPTVNTAISREIALLTNYASLAHKIPKSATLIGRVVNAEKILFAVNREKN